MNIISENDLCEFSKHRIIPCIVFVHYKKHGWERYMIKAALGRGVKRALLFSLKNKNLMSVVLKVDLC